MIPDMDAIAANPNVVKEEYPAELVDDILDLLDLVGRCTHRPTDLAFDHGGTGSTESEYRAAMGCDWMTVKESRNAIPPAYTEWIGRQLRAHLDAVAA